MDKAAEILTRYGRWFAVAVILSTIVPLSILPKARIDNSIDVWLARDSKEFLQYRDFLDRFGNEEFVVISTEVDNPLGEKSLAFQRDMVEKLKQIGNVDTVLSLSSLADELSQIRPDWKAFLADSVFAKNLLIGKNDHTLGIIVWLKRIQEPALRKKTVERIEAVVGDPAFSDYNFHLAGTPLMNVALDRGSQQASRTFLPVAMLVSILILSLVLRRITGVVAVISSVAATTIWTIGLLVASGRTLNMVTVTLPSLLFVLSLSGGVHITSRFISLVAAGCDRTRAMIRTLKEVILPILLSGATTAVGFGSLMISDMQPVIDFGIFAAVGIVLSVLVNLLVVPGMLMFLPIRSSAIDEVHRHFTCRIGSLMTGYKKTVVIFSILLLAVCIGCTTRARVESNVLKFFPDNSSISRDYGYIRDNLTGFYTIEIEFTTETQNAKQLLKDITQLADGLTEEPEIAKIIHYGSLADFVRDIQPPAFIGREQIRENPLRNMRDSFRIKDGDHIHLRMSIFIRAMSSNQFYSLLDRIDTRTRQTIDKNARYTITGVVPLLNTAQQSLIDTQIKSFSIAFAMVLLMIRIFIKSLRAMAAAVLPNILPIFILFSIMVITDIPIDAATVMIASIAIGIAVDDTIHFLSHFKTHRLNGEDLNTSVKNTFAGIGPAVTLTSIVATAGFLILCLAQFKPIRYFGLLAAVTMVTAWMGDVLILPASVSALNLWKTPASGGPVDE